MNLDKTMKKMLMIESLNPPLFVAFALGALIFILFSFLPALFAFGEKSRPERRPFTRRKLKYRITIASMEQTEEQEKDQTIIRRLAEVIAALPDIES